MVQSVVTALWVGHHHKNRGELCLGNVLNSLVHVDAEVWVKLCKVW